MGGGQRWTARSAREDATEGLTPIEAERAIYIDFEGTETEPPSFLGAAWADSEGGVRFVQYVLEPALWPAAEAATGVCGGTMVPADWPDLAELRRIAEAEDRRLIAWSDRERKALVDGVLDEDDRRWFDDNVLDAKPLAKRWKRRVRPEVVFGRDPRSRMRGRHRLDRYFGLIGYSVPKILGPGNSAQRIRAVRGQPARRGDYAALTRTVKGKWTKALAQLARLQRAPRAGRARRRTTGLRGPMLGHHSATFTIDVDGHVGPRDIQCSR